MNWRALQPEMSGRNSLSTTLGCVMRAGWYKMTDPLKMNWQSLMPVIITISLQTLALVWWTASTSANLESRISSLEKIPVTVERIVRLETTVNEMYRRFDRFEQKLDILISPTAPMPTAPSIPPRHNETP